jgi:hypothetical protein
MGEPRNGGGTYKEVNEDLLEACAVADHRVWDIGLDEGQHVDSTQR